MRTQGWRGWMVSNRLAVGACLGAAALVAAGCGGPGASTLGVGAGTQSTPTIHSLSSTTVRSSAQVTSPVCAGKSLAITKRLLADATHVTYFVFIITNDGSTECTLGGVPKLSFTTTAGALLYPLVQSSANVDGSTGAIQVVSVDLSPGGSASFWVEAGPCPGPLRPASQDVEGTLSVQIPGISGLLRTAPTSMAPGCSTDRWVVSVISPGIIKTAPGFTTGGSPGHIIERPGGTSTTTT